MTDMMNVDVSLLLNQEPLTSTDKNQEQDSEVFTNVLTKYLNTNEAKKPFVESQIEELIDAGNASEVESFEDTNQEITHKDEKIRYETDKKPKESLDDSKEEFLGQEFTAEFVKEIIPSRIQPNLTEMTSTSDEIKESIEALEKDNLIVLTPNVVTDFKGDIDTEEFISKQLSSLDLDFKSQEILTDDTPIVSKETDIVTNIIDLRAELNLPNKVLTREFINQLTLDTDIEKITNKSDIHELPLSDIELESSLSYQFSPVEKTTKIVRFSEELSVVNNLKKEQLLMNGDKSDNLTPKKAKETVAELIDEVQINEEDLVDRITNNSLRIETNETLEQPIKEYKEEGIAEEKIGVLNQSIEWFKETNNQPVELEHASSPKLFNEQEKLIFEEKTIPNVTTKMSMELENVTEFEPTQFKLEMKPENLGELEVILTKNEDKLSAEFVVKDSFVKEILEEQLPKLQDNLLKQDIKVDKTTVIVNSSNPLTFDFGGDLNQREQNKQNRFKNNQQKQIYESTEEFVEIEVMTEQDSINILV